MSNWQSDYDPAPRPMQRFNRTVFVFWWKASFLSRYTDMYYIYRFFHTGTVASTTTTTTTEAPQEFCKVLNQKVKYCCPLKRAFDWKLYIFSVRSEGRHFQRDGTERDGQPHTDCWWPRDWWAWVPLAGQINITFKSIKVPWPVKSSWWI